METKSAQSLEAWGFDGHFQGLFAQWCAEHPETPARVGRIVAWEHGTAEVVVEASERALLEPTGNLRRQRQQDADGGEFASGDWVVINAVSEPSDTGDGGRIIALLPRRSELRRRMAGSELRTQTIATNVDKVLVVTSANNDFNPRRLERYLVAVWDSGAKPVVVLNKSDLVHDVEDFLSAIRGIAVGADAVAVSAHSCQGLESLRGLLGCGETIALVGSSGVGKSSLLNRLVGTEMAGTGGIGAWDKGRHTTTRRAMVQLPNGSVLIDNPGIRELGLLESEQGLDAAFRDVVELAAGCRFWDCTHDGAPGCAVLAAIAEGILDERRLSSFQKLEREMTAMRARTDPGLQSKIKQTSKARTKAHRALKKLRGSRS